jgi:(2Fe-2S) ferredoxin
MSYYKYHVFFCTNQRNDGRQSCNDCGAQKLRDYAKQRCKELGISGPGQVRINSAGCLDRCQDGPALVVYPEETWYQYVDHADIDEIIDQHLVAGKTVNRLKI